jgi:hypothetical protein
MADLTWDLFLVMVLPLMTLAVFLAQSHARGLDRMVSLAFLYVIAVLACVAVLIYRLIKTGNRLDNLRTGCDAEVAVGQELDQLMRQGAAVFHDFPGEGFNIDHVVVSPRGVFAVETKGFSKPGDQRGKEGATVAFDGSSLAFPRWKTSEPLEQAERQAKWLASWLTSATGAATSVLPVLALPGWYVDRRGRGNVRVYSGGELRQLLQAVGTVSLDEQAVRRVVHQVEQRCRDVVPQYRK